MYITINDIKGEKRFDLSYPIYSRKEIAVSNNTQYEIKEPLDLKLMGNHEKRTPNGTYTMRELSAFVERKMIQIWKEILV